MDSDNIHLRIFVNIIMFTQDGIHFILDGIIKSMDKIIINLFFIYLWPNYIISEYTAGTNASYRN